MLPPLSNNILANIIMYAFGFFILFPLVAGCIMYHLSQERIEPDELPPVNFEEEEKKAYQQDRWSCKV